MNHKTLTEHIQRLEAAHQAQAARKATLQDSLKQMEAGIAEADAVCHEIVGALTVYRQWVDTLPEAQDLPSGAPLVKEA